MSVSTNDLKNGMALDLPQEGLVTVVEFQHVKPGKGGAFVRTKLKKVAGGAVVDRTFRADEKVPLAVIDKREMQYLYREGNAFVFMDNETYDQFALPDDLLGDSMIYLKPNTDVEVLTHDEKPITIDLPKTVTLTVTDTSPQPKGATATNQLKEATLETGLKTRVPQFISNGEAVVISTEDGSYLGRA